MFIVFLYMVQEYRNSFLKVSVAHEIANSFSLRINYILSDSVIKYVVLRVIISLSFTAITAKEVTNIIYLLFCTWITQYDWLQSFDEWSSESLGRRHLTGGSKLTALILQKLLRYDFPLVNCCHMRMEISDSSPRILMYIVYIKWLTAYHMKYIPIFNTNCFRL